MNTLAYLCYLFSVLLFMNTACLADSFDSEKFIVISDIHFDPFLGCDTQPTPCPLIQALQNAPVKNWETIFQHYHYASTITYKQDSHYLLLDSTIAELGKHKKDHLQFMILLGDTLAHRFNDKYATYAANSSVGYDEFVDKTVDFVNQQLQSAHLNVPIYPVIGNNDGNSGNYNVMPNGHFLWHMANTFSAYIPNPTFHDAFCHAGFYAIGLSPHQRLIVLNSVLFSNVPSKKAALDTTANQQLKWLKNQLILAHQINQSVLIAMHIPFGIDVSKTMGPLSALRNPNFWKKNYTQSVLKIAQQSSACITGLLVSHTHMDTFQIIQGSSPIPVIFTPAISTIHNNNPSFKIMTLSDTQGLTDFDTYFYPLEEIPLNWSKEYNFNETYQPNCQSCQIVNGLQNITPDHRAYYARYQHYFFASHSTEHVSSNQWKANRCATTYFNTASYQNCLSALSPNETFGFFKKHRN